jgi:PiT family inorganic phosphate transporter
VLFGFLSTASAAAPEPAAPEEAASVSVSAETDPSLADTHAAGGGTGAGWLAGIALLAGLAAALLGYGNGANDISKTIATLVGTGQTSYRKAVTAGAVASAVGGFAAAFLASRMVHTFSTGLVLADPTMHFSLAVIIGAVVWVLLATRFGMPVSTTHSITGAVVLTAVGAFGSGQVAWIALWKKILLPLLVSPVVAMAIAFALLGLVRVGFRACRGGQCAACHWVSAMASSFARAFNDIPKIVALLFTFGVAAGLTGGRAPFWMFLVIGGAAALGAFIAGLRVTETMAYRITDLDHEEGLTANLTTAAVVIATGVHGLPVSTTHVSSFAIMAGGLRDGVGAIRWGTVAEMALAWVVTLPVSGLFGLGAYVLLSHL